MPYFKNTSLILVTSAVSLSVAAPAHAGPVTASIVADNHSVAVLELNGTKTVIPNSGGSWPTAKTINFTLPALTAEQMRGCKIHIIAWGDGSNAQGIAAHFQGSLSASTGPGSPFLIKPVPNSVTGGIFPSNGSLVTDLQATDIVNAPGVPMTPGWTSLPVGVGGITGIWGPVVMPALGPNPAAYPANFTFIWDKSDLRADRSNYRVATLPCDKIEIPVVDVPGEHYQCYRIGGAKALKPENIVVADQFGKSEIVLGLPVMLCNPSVKVHNGKNYGILNKKVHQVCYNIVRQNTKQPVRRVRTANQFTTSEMTVDRRQMFCVPSYKTLLNGKEFPLE
jgi:hypothetical protein